MKHVTIISVLFSISLLTVNAQSYFEKYGIISQDEIEMNTCSYDPSADAVVLFDVGKSSFVKSGIGYDNLYERITRIKILNESGKRFAVISIPYYQEGGM